MSDVQVKRALLSVYDKTGLVEFAQGLADLGIKLISTGGTYRKLKEAGIAVTPVDEVTAQVQRELVAAKAAVEAGSGDGLSEVQMLQHAVHKLEQMVRDRTEQLNKLQWQHRIAAREDSAGSDSGNKLLMVLNQQLASAREDNARLLEKVRTLESGAAGSAAPSDAADEATTGALAAEVGGATDDLAADDLTRIRGIGPTLVKKLTKLGITRFDQIATLGSAELEDEGHPLHERPHLL